jgi:CDP-glucose 4,6-dehydratase
MIPAQVSPSFWSGKKVFLTGHTGFKGSWLSLWLSSMGAQVTGYGLPPDTEPNLYTIFGVERLISRSYLMDIRRLENFRHCLEQAKPEILIHMAAQPLVGRSYKNPIHTYETNVMGTANVLESARGVDTIRSSIIVTTDKCYENKEWPWGYRESDALGGYDPYSSSKGCAELVTSAYRTSFFPLDDYKNHKHALATARAGNVIGGGDWSVDRLIPDAIRAFQNREAVIIRNPHSIRPWQHVLEPLSGYLILAQNLYDNGPLYSSAWNFGPNDDDAISVRDLMNLFTYKWSNGASWLGGNIEQFHEAHYLKLDCSKSKSHLNWASRWDLNMALDAIIEWYREFENKNDMRAISLKQINLYTNS